MTTATRHIEGDALAALRGELMRAAARRTSTRRRTRRVAIAVALIAGLLAATAGAAAVTNISTGVPAVDELLAIEKGFGSGPGGLPTGYSSEPVEIGVGDATYQLVAYLNRRGEVATVFAERHNGGVRGGGSGGGYRAGDLSRRLARRGAMLHGGMIGADQRIYYGEADGRVQSVHVEDPGDWTVKMSPPWTPPVEGARPIRVLVVIDERDIDVGDDGVQMGELPDFRIPELELEPAYAK